MRSLKNVNIKKSIETKRLVFDESWYDKSDTYFQYFVYLILILFPIPAIKLINPTTQNSNFEYAIFFIPIIIGLYSLYCKLLEKKLKELKFTVDKEEAIARILAYGKKDDYRISKIGHNLIYLNEWTGEVSHKVRERTIIIFFTESSILYTLIKEGMRMNSPVLINQHIVRRELKKLLK